MENFPPSLKGHFLISMPGLADPNFFRTVTCVCDHTSDGAVGIVVNRIHPSILAKEIFNELKIEYELKAGNLPIFLGGPVHTNEIFMLHGPPFHWDRSLRITPYLALSNTRDLLEAVAAGQGPESILISLGCAGWGPAQLEGEIRENAWLTGPLSEEIIFDTPIESRWEAALRKIGIEPSLLSETAGHA
jgi:putative transcriptional regulator